MPPIEGVRYVLVLKRVRHMEWYRKSGGRDPYWISLDKKTCEALENVAESRSMLDDILEVGE